MNIGKFKFPIDDTTEEVDDELEYYTDDAWQDFDPDEDEGYDSGDRDDDQPWLDENFDEDTLDEA